MDRYVSNPDPLEIKARQGFRRWWKWWGKKKDIRWETLTWYLFERTIQEAYEAGVRWERRRVRREKNGT